MAHRVVVIAGPNGAGKTTFARWYLPMRYPDTEFLNAEEIQLEGAVPLHRVGAGKEFLRRLSGFEERHQSFAIEITLSSRRFAMRFRRWAVLGYRISLHFIELPSVEIAFQRVEVRVAAGGHGVPESEVRRRFRRGLRLFHEVYKGLADEWYHWHSDEGGTRLVDHWKGS